MHSAAQYINAIPDSITLCIFDLDGTLIQSIGDIAFSVNTALNKTGLPQLPIRFIAQAVGTGARDLIARCYAKSAGYRDPLKAPEKYKSDTDFFTAADKLLSDYRLEYKSHCTDTTQLYPNIIELLKNLREKGIIMAVLSNKPKSDSEKILRSLGILPYFFTVLGPESTGKRKPDPAGILFCIKQAEKISGTEISPQKTLIAGDSDIDIKAGKAAGIHTLGITGGFCRTSRLRAAHPDILI